MRIHELTCIWSPHQRVLCGFWIFHQRTLFFSIEFFLLDFELNLCIYWSGWKAPFTSIELDGNPFVVYGNKWKSPFMTVKLDKYSGLVYSYHGKPTMNKYLPLVNRMWVCRCTIHANLCYLCCSPSVQRKRHVVITRNLRKSNLNKSSSSIVFHRDCLFTLLLCFCFCFGGISFALAY